MPINTMQILESKNSIFMFKAKIIMTCICTCQMHPLREIINRDANSMFDHPQSAKVIIWYKDFCTQFPTEMKNHFHREL